MRPGAHPEARARRGGRALSRLSYAALLAALAGLVACGDSSPSPSVSPTPLPPSETSVAVGPVGNGITEMGTTVAVGGRVTIVAPENPSTGYAWTLKVPVGVTTVSEDYEGPTASASPIVGAGGTRTWVVRVEQVGRYVVRGSYVRPWESRSPASRFAIAIFAGPPDQPMPTIVFTAQDSPAHWITDVGTVAAICLAEDGTTGYAWRMELSSGLRLLADQASSPSSSPSPVVGAGGQHVWLVAVDEAGSSAAKGEYLRAWEDGVSAATFSLTIAAKAPGAD